MNKNVKFSAGPLFVVGMNGSGTTMMLDHLGQHPDLFAFRGETHILPYYLQEQRSYGDLHRDSNFLRLWNDIRSSYVFRWKNRGKPLDLPEDWQKVNRNAAAIFDRIMLTFAVAEGKTRWSEKTPMNVLHMLRIAEAFPNALFLHMIRDGRECAASDARRWGRHPVGTIYRWKYVISEGRRQGREIGDRYCEMRYESVTEDPEKNLRVACTFAGLEFDERILQLDRPRPHVTGQDSKTIKRNTSRNKGYFGEKRLRELEQIAGGCLKDLGYETRFYDIDSVPSQATRAWWIVHDAYRVVFRNLRMKLTVQKRMTWPMLFRHWKTILQSKRSNRQHKLK